MNYPRTFDGLIDDVAIWNRVLSAAEVNSYYKNSSTCDESTPSNQLGCDIDGESQNDYSGYGIDMSDDGTIVAIGAVGNIGENGNGGAPGHVRVYKYDAGSWSQLGADIDGTISYDANNSTTGDFGHSVALSSDGTILAVGDRFYSPGSTVNTGLVNVYQYSSGSWNQIGSSILGELDGSHFGFDVDLSSDGTILAVGAPRSPQGGDQRGAVLLYEYSNSSWSKIGDSILGSEVGARFGYDVSLSNDGTIVAAGEPYAYTNYSGGVRVYKNSGGSWTQLGNDITNSSGEYDELGVTVDISGNGLTLAAGSPDDDDGANNGGSVKIYNYTPGGNVYTNGSWGNPTEIYGTWYNGEMGRGLSMSYNGNMIALGGTRSNTNGAVNLYTYDGSSWTNASTFLGEAGGDYYGDQVSLSADGSIVAISGHRNDGNGTDAGHVEVFSTGLLDEIDSSPPTLTETTLGHQI